MSMDLNNVEEEEPPMKVIWPNVTAKGKLALKKIQTAMINQTSTSDFRNEIIEALQPVFNEVYLLVKTSVKGYEDFLDQFPELHDLKNPVWAHMFNEIPYNAANVPNADLKKQLTDMEIKLKAVAMNMPTTNEFIKVKKGMLRV